MTKPFNPAWGSNQLATLVAATEQHLPINKDNESLLVQNTGATNPMYFRTYNSGSTARPIAAASTIASTADRRVNPGQSVLVAFDYNHDGISLISAAGTTVEVMTGTGGV